MSFVATPRPDFPKELPKVFGKSFQRSFKGLPQDFPKTFQRLSKDFPRISKKFQRFQGVEQPCLWRESIQRRMSFFRPFSRFFITLCQRPVTVELVGFNETTSGESGACTEEAIDCFYKTDRSLGRRISCSVHCCRILVS